MNIGLISDTHDHVTNIKKAVDIFSRRKVDLVLHAGDYCSPFTIPPFAGLPLKGILGNNDGDHYLLMQKFNAIEAELAGYFLELEASGRKIALYHGTNAPITSALHECGKYDVVVSGHTHEKVQKKVGNTLAVNPGTAHGFDEKASIALLDTESLNVEFIEL